MGTTGLASHHIRSFNDQYLACPHGQKGVTITGAPKDGSGDVKIRFCPATMRCPIFRSGGCSLTKRPN